MVCDVADLRCLYVNELVGDPVLAVLLFGVLFFAFTSYNRVGLKSTLWLAVVVFPIVSYFIIGTTLIIALSTLVVSFLVALIHTRITGNR